jgi:hypothetical protein
MEALLRKFYLFDLAPARSLRHSERNRTGRGAIEAHVGETVAELDVQMQMISDVCLRQHTNAICLRKPRNDLQNSLSMSAERDASSVVSPVAELLHDPFEYCAALHHTHFFAGPKSPFGASVSVRGFVRGGLKFDLFCSPSVA